MKEFNNRKKADKYAEYITGKALRRYVAKKVKKYVGEGITVFDGACGSGQLEEYIKPKFLYGVEIQEEAAEAARENFPQSDITVASFFNYEKDVTADCTVMNPPFSLKFKELPTEEQDKIQQEFSWKKSGVVDDIFILKGLQHAKRYGFFIGFPGITYRKSESKFRKETLKYLVELAQIEGGFEDTDIPVAFMVFDLEKKGDDVQKEIYDCKTEEVVYKEVSEDYCLPRKPIQKEVYDPIQLEVDARNAVTKAVKGQLALSKLFCELDEQLPPFENFVEDLNAVIQVYRGRR